MAKTPYVSDRAYLAKARILKKFGLLEINLRDKLTPALKTKITKLTTHAIETQIDEDGNTKTYNRPPLKSLIENPELFATRKVNKKQAAKWKQSGYKIINGRVVVRGEKDAKIKVYAMRIRIERALIVDDIYLFGSKDFFAVAKDLLSRQLAKHEYVTGRFGNYGVFKHSYVTYESFYRYVSEMTENFTNDLTATLQLVHTYRKNPEQKKAIKKSDFKPKKKRKK